jgi:hypothetical protein
MDVVVVESAVTPQDDLQSHAQSRIHQNEFDTIMAASSVRTGMIVVNKDTTILQLLQYCVERKVLNSVNAMQTQSIVEKDGNGTSFTSTQAKQIKLLLDFAFKFISSEQIAQVKAFKSTNNNSADFSGSLIELKTKCSDIIIAWCKQSTKTPSLREIQGSSQLRSSPPSQHSFSVVALSCWCNRNRSIFLPARPMACLLDHLIIQNR